MTLAIYPDQTLLPGLGYDVKWTPEFQNLTQITQSGAAVQIALSPYPLHNFELVYNFLRTLPPSGLSVQPEFAALLSFFASVGGSAGRFLFRNVDMDSQLNLLIGIGDNVTTTFAFTHDYRASGFAVYPALEPVGFVQQTLPLQTWNPTLFPGISNTEVIRVGGTLQVAGTDYTISNATPGAPTVTFTVAPSSSTSVIVSYGYYFYCRLGDDTLVFSKSFNQIWAAQSVKLVSCRPGA